MKSRSGSGCPIPAIRCRARVPSVLSALAGAWACPKVESSMASPVGLELDGDREQTTEPRARGGRLGRPRGRERDRHVRKWVSKRRIAGSFNPYCAWFHGCAGLHAAGDRRFPFRRVGDAAHAQSTIAVCVSNSNLGARRGRRHSLRDLFQNRLGGRREVRGACIHVGVRNTERLHVYRDRHCRMDSGWPTNSSSPHPGRSARVCVALHVRVPISRRNSVSSAA